MSDWKDQRQVCVSHLVYAKVDMIARFREMTVEEWVDKALRKAIKESPDAVEALTQSIAEAQKLNIPTADIDVMLKEIESGYNSL